MFLGNNVEIYMSSVFTVTYTIFLLLILEVFNALLALKPNLKEVTEAISPFDFVFRFSTMENFSKLEGERLYVPNATFIKIYKIAGMVTLIVDSGTAFFNKVNTPIFNIPEKYRPNETLYFSASYRNNTKSNTFFLYANGNLIKSEADDNAGAYYFTITYPAKTIN